jgi:ABC-2 type transport system permease protein
MAFGLTVTVMVLVISMSIFGLTGTNWLMLVLALLLSATAFSAMGAFVSVAVKEVFEAQTLANFIRFPMMFLGGVFVPLASMPVWLQVLARLFPLTYSVEALRAALSGGTWATAVLDLGALVVFSLVLFLLAVFTLARGTE